jgi:hypothetical protein
MAEFQWWLLIVGLVAGGGLVAVIYMDSRRREVDVEEVELEAEAAWIAERLSATRAYLDRHTVEAVLRVHREYLSLPPPDRLVAEPDGEGYHGERREGDTSDRVGSEPETSARDGSDRDADGQSDHIGDRGGGGPDEHLPRTREEQATARQEADAGANRE